MSLQARAVHWSQRVLFSPNKNALRQISEFIHSMILKSRTYEWPCWEAKWTDGLKPTPSLKCHASFKSQYHGLDVRFYSFFISMRFIHCTFMDPWRRVNHQVCLDRCGFKFNKHKASVTLEIFRGHECRRCPWCSLGLRSDSGWNMFLKQKDSFVFDRGQMMEWSWCNYDVEAWYESRRSQQLKEMWA